MAGLATVSKRSGTACPNVDPGCSTRSRTLPVVSSPSDVLSRTPSNPVSTGVTREKPSARLSDVGTSGGIGSGMAARLCWLRFTRSPVGVVGSTTVYVFDGHGRRQRVPSIDSHAAESGIRWPGMRFGT